MKRVFIIHLLCAIPAALAFFAFAVMFIMKLAELGAGPTLTWMAIGGTGFAGLFLLVLDVVLVLKFRPSTGELLGEADKV
jgi:hypothetical protein